MNKFSIVFTVTAILLLSSGVISWSEPAENFVLVKSGNFLMGSSPDDTDWQNNESQHLVFISRDFYICKYEVTVGEFRRFVEESGWEQTLTAVQKDGIRVWTGRKWMEKADASWENPYMEQSERDPVTCVSWYDAVEYCNWLSIMEGLTPAYKIDKNLADRKNYNKYHDTIKWTVTCNFLADGYRLPTEAEWEYAARGGHKSEVDYKYAGSSDIERVAWYRRNSGHKTHPAGHKQPNELRIYDMSGNVEEWCWNWYGPYPVLTARDPVGPSGGKYRVFRGGNWASNTVICRNAYRNTSPPTTVGVAKGFRLVRTAR
jgi:formylglycine-generating enzyme